ncbi:sialidase-like [Branchiostoma floridae]|nr:sialidase-like [Branchiostoma floridae]
MAVRNPVNAMVDVEEEAITNFPQSLQCDETQSATEATGTQSQYVTEPVTTQTAEAEIHIYSNDDTSTCSDEDEEAQHHQYASAAPPPVPDDDDDDGNPGQETTGYSTEMVQEDDSTSQIESGDDHKPYGIAAANVVYQATAVHHSLSHGNPTAVQQSLSHGNPTTVQQSLSYDNPTAARQSLSYGNPTAVQQSLSHDYPTTVQQSLSYDNSTAARQSLSYDNPAANYSVANANDVEMDSHLPTNTLYGQQSASACPAEAAVNPLYGKGLASAQ